MSSILIAVVTGTPKIETDFPSGFHVIAGIVLPFSVFSVTTKILKKEVVFPHLKKSHFLVIQYQITFVVTTGNIRQLEKKNPPFYQKSLAFFRGNTLNKYFS